MSQIVAVSNGHTGYTHQWHNPLFAAYRQYIMASVDTLRSYEQAHAAGWRTFRVSNSLDLAKGEIVCVNTSRGISCADCRLCAGTSKGANTKSIVIEVHGTGKGHLSTL